MINDSNKGSINKMHKKIIPLKKFIAFQFRFALGATSINSFFFLFLFLSSKNIFGKRKTEKKNEK